MGTTKETTDQYEEKRIAHQRAVEDIMEDLERERSKGLWANQMSIKDLEKRLRRENEDWERYLGDREEEGTESGSIYDSLNSALEETGNQVDEITNKTKSLLDEVKELGIAWDIFKVGVSAVIGYGLARIIGGWIAKIGIFAGAQGMGFTIAQAGGLTAAFVSLGAVISSLPFAVMVGMATAAFVVIRNEVNKFKNELDSLNSSLRQEGDLESQYITQLKKRWQEGTLSAEEYRKKVNEIFQSQKQESETIKELNKSLQFFEWPWETFQRYFQFGGIVPGRLGQPVPIMAHAGERIVPSRETGTQGNIVVNINNPSVRSDNDIQKIADAVSRALGQRTRWQQMGA